MKSLPTIRAFRDSPDQGRGLARDMPVRWALEEVGQRYEVHTVSFDELKKPEHRSLQPFGQIPTYQENRLNLFESAAIVLRIAETHPGLLPVDPDARSRAIAWMFAAKATVEPVIVELEAAILSEKGQPWFEARKPIMEDRIRTRLTDLSNRLGDADWLDGDFTAGDLLMINVLRRPASTPLQSDELKAYVLRGQERPAFKRAFQAQHAVWESSWKRALR